MAERDRFELDLAAALRTYLEEAPTEVRPTELARHFATEYPPRRTSISLWRFAAIPRPALALLLAGLLAALVGGTLLVGSQQRRLPAVVPPVGQVFECPPGSNPVEPGPVDQDRPPQYPGAPTAIAFDRRAGKLVALVITNAAVETWTFDICTNTWTQMHPDREPPAFERAGLIYDVDSDVSILVTSERVWVSSSVESHTSNLQPYSGVWAYNLRADSWTQKGAAPIDATLWSYPKLWAYDRGSGRVVAALGPDLWSYDVATDTWTPIHQANVPGDNLFRCAFFPCVAYDASVDRIIAYTAHTDRGPETWLLDLRTGTWSRSLAEAATVVVGWDSSDPAMEYDEAAGRTVVFGEDRLGIYDAKVDHWEVLTKPEPRFLLPIEMAYDAVNRRLVGLGRPDVLDGVVASLGGVDALDLATQQWTVLLERGEEQPSLP